MQIVSICSNQIEIYRKVEEDQRADEDHDSGDDTQKYNKSNNKHKNIKQRNIKQQLLTASKA